MQKTLEITNENKFFRNIILKALGLFVILNIFFTLSDPLPALGQISAYNSLFPGRTRLPYGDQPELAYNLSLFQLDAMFASHEIDGMEKSDDEYRVIIIGDSATWGFLLKPEETMAAYINASRYTMDDGRRVKVFNLGYPTMSLVKDLLILDYALAYEPDMIVWLVTLESFPHGKQLSSPILQHNPEPVRTLIQKYNLDLDLNDPAFVDPTLWERTIIGNRRTLADLLRLQFYGVMWAASGIDQYYPDIYESPAEDLHADDTYYEFSPPQILPKDLAIDLLDSGVLHAGEVPVLVVNEPLFISQGENSHIRYNYYYPRWVYDQYRQLMADYSQSQDWQYMDLWDVIPSSEFSNTAIHLTPKGSQLLASMVGEAITKSRNR